MRFALSILAVVIVTSPILSAGCGDTADNTTSTDIIATTSNSPQDQAARLAAQSQLRNTQMTEESYFAENQRYAVSTSELRGVDPRLSSKVEVISGSASGYAIQVTANDSQNTVFILRKSGSRIERVDENGNPW